MSDPTEHKTASSGSVLVKTMGFSLFLIIVFTLFTNLLPQVEGEAPVDKEVDIGALTMESFVELGEELFHGKGTCSLCHNDLGRAPDILVLDMTATSKKHLADERYEGTATDDGSYLLESLVNPGIYVVAGFGKKGSNDTESQMPAVDKAPIELTALEMDAVIAFMQAKDGNDVTVSLPSEAPAASTTAEASPKAAQSAEEVIAKLGCAACHSLENSDQLLGPSLQGIGSRLSVEEIRQSIIDPEAVIPDGFEGGMMPATFAEQVTAKEMEMMVQFLAKQK